MTLAVPMPGRSPQRSGSSVTGSTPPAPSGRTAESRKSRGVAMSFGARGRRRLSSPWIGRRPELVQRTSSKG
jgi:hypothetical protein